MRLLYFNSSGRLTSTDFSGKTIPPYAILSHTWGDDEFLFEDLMNGTGDDKTGYEKIVFCGEQAARDNIQYFWVDTCCIDKWKLSELSYAINSMYQWYKNAAICYAFLWDVETPMVGAQQDQITWEASFRKSRWFTRGWTLQELLAPASVVFFSSGRQRLGDKRSLEQQVHEITRIPVAALRGDPLDEFSVQERMKWIAGRQTKEEEDMAYSLIGIFGVSMELRYNEGKERALERLQEEREKAKTTPFIIPFDQNARFVGRESQLDELERKLFTGTSTTKTAITGPGGIGKTQLAIELAHRIKRGMKNCSVFWVSARDVESLYQGYTRIAQRLNLLGWDDEKADARRLVQLYLSKESSGQWLLVFDNADEARLESTRSSKAVNLIECLPSSKQGAIVFTTANKETAIKLASDNIMELQEMEQHMARRMLDMYLAPPANEQEKADLLLKELSHLPLAIVQAAAYIKVNNITLEEYISLLAKKREDSIKSIGGECESVIATTWLISFEQIRCQDTLAADYLLLMACVNRSDVPLDLLHTDSSRENTIQAVATLNAYSFVTKRPAESALEIHRLVHGLARNWLQDQGLLSKWTQVAIERLCEVFPNDDHGSRSKWRRLLPHAKFVLSSRITAEENEARTGLLWKYATALQSDGRWNEAEDLLMEVVETNTRVHGEEHPDTLTSMSNLASTYGNQGRWKEAEKLQARELEISSRVFGEEHPDTLTSMSNLASTYIDQGRWKEAEELEMQVIEIRKKVLGEEHPDTLTSMSNLASTYSNQGRWKEAERLQTKELEISSRIFGEEHPDTLTSMSNLASTYSDQGRWKEAEKLQLKELEICSRVLGEEHPDTLTSVANLALTYSEQGRWRMAEELEVQVMETRKRLLGEEHPDTLISMSNLASTYTDQGWWKKAEALEVQVMEIRKRVLGEEHPDTLTSIANLASTYRDQGWWKKAKGLEMRVIEMQKRVLGEEHPDTLTSIANLAATYSDQGQWKKAEELEVEVMEIRKRVLGEEHPDTLTSISNLALTYSEQGQWKKAERLEVQVMEIRKRLLGEEHPDTLISMANLASTYTDQGRWKKAEDLEVQVMEIRKRVLGEEHPDTLTSIANLALTYSKQGRQKKAEELEVEVIEMRKRVLGEEHPDTLTSISNLALTYSKQGRKNEAKELDMQVMEIRTRVLGEEHPSTLVSMANLAHIFKSQGRSQDAVPLMEKCSQLQEQVLGAQHPDAISSVKTLNRWQLENTKTGD